MFVLLFVSRGMDFFSTWVATPNMVLEETDREETRLEMGASR